MELETQITNALDVMQDEMRRSLMHFIAIPTVNPPGESYENCTALLSRMLRDCGVGHRILRVPHETHPRFSIVGSFGAGEDGLHFHGHYDVVAAQSPRQFEPFEKDGRIYGRGASDMKGGIVSMLYAIRAIRECGIRLGKRITVTLSPDEETGGLLGIRHLAHEELLPEPAFGALMPEPAGGNIWSACRGALSLGVTIRGRTAHVGLEHEGINAFEQMSEVVRSLLELKRRVQERRTALAIRPPEADRSVMLIGGRSAGGTNFNVVPDAAFFSIDRRLNPEETLDQARTEIEEALSLHRERGVEVEVEIFQEGEPAAAAEDTPLGEILFRTVHEVTGSAPSFELCPGILETRFFSSRGFPGYAYGPGLLEVSHGPGEYVRMQDVLDCARIYALVACRLMAITGTGA